MKVLINATALSDRGGFSVVAACLEDLAGSEAYFNENNIRVTAYVSREELLEYRRSWIDVIVTKKPKKSPGHQWWFERQVLRKEMKDHDVFLSLQNTPLGGINKPQYCLIHQPIPFSDVRPGELEWKNLLKYKLLMPQVVKRALPNMAGIFVQTEWMKEAVQKRYGAHPAVHVMRPKAVDIKKHTAPLTARQETLIKQSRGRRLVYVTNQEKYKNNDRLIEAIRKYNKHAEQPIDLFLTVEGNNETGIHYLGKVNYEAMYTLYTSMDALVFPSLMETFGLPVVEARQSGLPVLLADLPYGREHHGKGKTLLFNPRSTDSIMQSFRELEEINTRQQAPTVKEAGNDYLEFIQTIQADQEKNSPRSGKYPDAG
ncbi:glycosyltransferase [Marinococcus luteus]|uniref:glycosyltransferase n=1 Tax=Marinococcus luteus TaxID=1122204 RepID=UPI002ACCF075|nr:glycosyltransferase [Marinococcus luteus]MDZ5784216.1 glycosyltransferase [Marinococcus luteus]